MKAAEWSVWSTTARLVVTDPSVLDEARGLCDDILTGIGLAASRFDPASALSALATDGRPQAVSPLLSDLIAEALGAASVSEGAVDPTVGGTLVDLGYDRDISLIRTGDRILARVRPVPGWKRVSLARDVLTLPVGVVLDLGATAKASATDRCARAVAARFRVGALVSIGGDIATAGSTAGWQIEVRDLPEDEPSQVELPSGWAISTSSARRRTWTAGGELQHHLIDPCTSRPVTGTWAAVSAVARTCLAANTATTAAMVKGVRGQDWLDRIGISARALTTDGRVVRFGDWRAGVRAA